VAFRKDCWVFVLLIRGVQSSGDAWSICLIVRSPNKF